MLNSTFRQSCGPISEPFTWKQRFASLPSGTDVSERPRVLL